MRNQLIRNHFVFIVLSTFLISFTGCETTTQSSRPIENSSEGSIEGYVSLKPRSGIGPEILRSGSYNDRRFRDVEKVDYRTIDYAVVYLNDNNPQKSEVTIVLSQSPQGLSLEPRFGAVGINNYLIIHNTTGSPHVFSSPELKFLRRVNPGEKVEIKASQPGEVSLSCMDIKDQKSTVFVAPGTFTVAEENGRWRMDNLKPGTATVGAWHPRFPLIDKGITVEKSRSKRMNISFSVDELNKG